MPVCQDVSCYAKRSPVWLLSLVLRDEALVSYIVMCQEKVIGLFVSLDCFVLLVASFYQNLNLMNVLLEFQF